MVVSALLRVLFSFRVEGLERYPAGAAVLVANHPSALDPLFIAAAVPDRVLFLAAGEFLALPAVGWAMRTYGCIPVRRGEVETDAVREALLALTAGRKVGVFPEGRVSPQPRPPRRGAALLAARAGAPITPVALIGTGRVFPLGARLPRPGRVVVRVGPALPPPADSRGAQEAAIAEAMAWIRAQDGAAGEGAIHAAGRSDM
ncbi:MAG: lysophospholipid acyltransferase family protein [Armatimonadota bacterium]|nr:lysophospholipid acyltransferase family protein [Armatimonadota bacterium]MDR7518234.1 lysophospholipid acyltransferase family protein [Armatimonadota bacterium]MDR7548658.1 lysophospholipid acyltransferase family protein [Armatimonadota bacterium]